MGQKTSRMRKPFLFLAWTLLALSTVLPVVIAIVIRLVTNAWPTWTGIGLFALPDGTYLPPKTLWDLWQLLLIPIVLAVIAWFFTRSERMAREQNELRRFEVETELADKRAKVARELALEAQRDGALRAYFDSMTHLLLEYKLVNSNNKMPARDVAHARTIAVLRMLDSERKADILRFLYGAALITGQTPVIRLQRADFSGIDLSNHPLININLSGANLSQTNFKGANLQQATLINTNLRECDLRRTKLHQVDFSRANVSGVNFSRCDMHEVNWSLSQADDKTIWPEGWDDPRMLEYEPEMEPLIQDEFLGVS